MYSHKIGSSMSARGFALRAARASTGGADSRHPARAQSAARRHSPSTTPGDAATISCRSSTHIEDRWCEEASTGLFWCRGGHQLSRTLGSAAATGRLVAMRGCDILPVGRVRLLEEAATGGCDWALNQPVYGTAAGTTVAGLPALVTPPNESAY
jgi:hypothetical protein